VFYAELCGDYGCSKQAGNAFNSIEVTVSDSDDPSSVVIVQNWAALSNLPNTLSGKVSLQQGHTYVVKFSGNIDNGRLFVIEPSRGTFSLTSRHSSFIDYYLTWAGADSLSQPLDSAVRGYRSITGDVPPYALWAYGFWQCKEHYATQAELLNASATFRALGIPVDNIVQDWRYWGSLGWGPQWDKSLYPDPAGMIAQLHKENFHFMISVYVAARLPMAVPARQATSHTVTISKTSTQAALHTHPSPMSGGPALTTQRRFTLKCATWAR
jgi:alpha-D-xyloside xylohydrolase